MINHYTAQSLKVKIDFFDLRGAVSVGEYGELQNSGISFCHSQPNIGNTILLGEYSGN